MKTIIETSTDLEVCAVEWVKLQTVAKKQVSKSVNDRCTAKPRTKKPAPTPTNTLYQVGDRVTNARGWHGVVDRIDTESYPHPYYWVKWKERAQHQDKEVAKRPVCGHLGEQIWKP